MIFLSLLYFWEFMSLQSCFEVIRFFFGGQGEGLKKSFERVYVFSVRSFVVVFYAVLSGVWRF